MDTQGDGVKNVNERDDLDVDMWNTRSNTGQRRRPRPNPTPTEAHSDAANTSGVKRVKGARCQSSDVFLELNHSLLSSKLYLWGRHRRMRLPASLRMCFPAPKVHFLPPFAKQCTAQAYYAKYRQQCEEVHSKLVESQYQTPPHDREPEGETKDKSGVATSEQTSQERKSNEEKTKGDSREEGRAQGKIRADADLDDVPTLDLLRSLPRSAAAKLIIEECGADPETVETFLRILDSTELVVGLHPDQATEPLVRSRYLVRFGVYCLKQ